MTSQGSTRPLIEIKNLRKVYQTPAGDFTAVNGINVEVQRGEFVAIIGKSGSGKSTFINMITGIDRPTSGEIIINGAPVATQKLLADGTLRTLTFDVPIERSSWIAARILPSSHSNPVFALVGGQPVRASRASAEWCLNAVNQCWSQKAPQIRANEVNDARAAYDFARQVYKQRLSETK